MCPIVPNCTRIRKSHPSCTLEQVAAQHQEEQHALEERIEERLKEAAGRRCVAEEEGMRGGGDTGR